jgi:hypothetical protein
VLDDFEVDEGHFRWVYNTSPVSQTFGLTSATTIDRVTSEHQSLGVGSQELNLVATSPTTPWQIRHNSSITAQAAVPAGNVPLAPTGYVGFWVKTYDAGAGTIQISVDDPVAAGATAIEKGEPIQIIADNQWHLYQWNLADADDWTSFNLGSDGVIDAVNGFVTIDSIWITGVGSAQIYLDTVSHNPNGMLAALIPGDYDRDGLVNAEDYTVWRAAFGDVVLPGSGADGNSDGVVDQGDYLIFRKQMSVQAEAGTGAQSASAPEPGSICLIAMALVAGFASRRRPARDCNRRDTTIDRCIANAPF